MGDHLRNQIPDIHDSVDPKQMKTDLVRMLTDPETEERIVHKLTDSVAIQFVQQKVPDGVDVAIEIVVNYNLISDQRDLYSYGDASVKVTEMNNETVGDVSDEKVKALEEIISKASEHPVAIPATAFVYGLLAGIEIDELLDNTETVSMENRNFMYAFNLNPDGSIVGDTEESKDMHNPLDVEASVFFDMFNPTYDIGDLPQKTLDEFFKDKPNNTHQTFMGEDVEDTDAEIGDVFYNTNTEEYCWIVSMGPILGAFLQYEDGTFWDQQLRGDGVPVGPYQRTELPDDYDKQIPDPHNICDIEDHDFDFETPPTSYHDTEQRLCTRCGMSTMTLIELCGQFVDDKITFQCIGCDTTGLGEELISFERLEEVAICTDCWNPNLSGKQNYDMYR